MTDSGMPVRRSNSSIALDHSKSSRALLSTAVSGHIDSQRRVVLDLEKENLWIDSEIRALRRQMEEISKKIEIAAEPDSRESELDRQIAELTSSAIRVCLTGYSNDTRVVNLGKDLRETNQVKAPPLELHELDSEVQLCSAIIDFPTPDKTMQDYLAEYSGILSEIVGSGGDTFRISSASRDEKQTDALRVFFYLKPNESESLSHFTQTIADIPDSDLDSRSRRFLAVTRSVILDADPLSPSNYVAKKSSTRRDVAPAAAETDLVSERDDTARLSISGPIMDASAPTGPDVKSPSVRELIRSLEHRTTSIGSSSVSGPHESFRRSYHALDFEKDNQKIGAFATQAESSQSEQSSTPDDSSIN